MMLGNMPFFTETKTIGEVPGDQVSQDIAKLKSEVKWMKWAIILLLLYILYKEVTKETK
jgi:hypothetical protein